MIQGGKQEERVSTQGSFTGFRRDVSGVIFRLVPRFAGAAFPVHVVLDDDDANPVVVWDRGWHGETPFSSLKVNVAPGGGSDGDRWLLYYGPERSDRGRQHLATNDRGQVEVVSGGARELVRLNSKIDFSPFAAAHGLGTDKLWLKTDGTFSADGLGEDAFDLSQYQGAALGVTVRSYSGANYFRASLDVYPTKSAPSFILTAPNTLLDYTGRECMALQTDGITPVNFQSNINAVITLGQARDTAANVYPMGPYVRVRLDGFATVIEFPNSNDEIELVLSVW